MKTLVLFGSTRSSTRQVVNRLQSYLTFRYDTLDVRDLSDGHLLQSYELLLFLAPTYGDGELQDDMEAFLTQYADDLSGKHFSVCELGNYYGYDDFAHGAMPIIRHILLSLNATELVPPASMDSLPKKDWNTLETWCGLLNKAHQNE